MVFRMVYKSGQIFLPFCQGSRMWQTDGRTDGQTEFSSLDRVCIPCSAVIKWSRWIRDLLQEFMQWLRLLCLFYFSLRSVARIGCA